MRRAKRNTKALLEQRKNSAEQTCARLHYALDRFENRQLINLPTGSQLTIRNVAIESGVSKDTPLSRYRKGQPNEGEYRFPDVVARFNSLKEKLLALSPPKNLKDGKIHELRQNIKTLKEQFLLANRANNQLDAESYEKSRRNLELEELITKLRQDSLKVVPFDKSKKRKKK